MNRVLGSVVLLSLCTAPPVAAQVLTLDQLFWLREKPSLDDAEYLEVEHGWRWQSGKDVTLSDSLYYSTNWIFLDAHQKRLAELIYESRGSSNVVSLTYSTSSSRVYNALKAQVTAYHMQYVGQQHKRGADWTYFRYEQDYDVGLAVYATPKVAHPTWYTIFIRPRWR
jgi:hypothetical protein